MSPSKGTPAVVFRLRPPELRAELEAEARANGQTLTDLINRVLAQHVAERKT